MITYLNIKCKTTKLLEENLHYLQLRKEFLDTTPKAQYIKEKKW